MEDRDLAEKLLHGVVYENMAIYRQLFTETKAQDATDKYWGNALAMFEKLDIKDREVFFSILEQVSIDTVSNVSGAIDGSTEIGFDGDIQIVTESGKTLGGCLQDYFLEAVEEKSK